MKLSNPIRSKSIALLLAAACIFGSPAHAATTTDISDLWWIPSESGWGVQFVQEELTIFATMFVYGPNGQPTSPTCNSSAFSWWKTSLPSVSMRSSWPAEMSMPKSCCCSSSNGSVTCAC